MKHGGFRPKSIWPRGHERSRVGEAAEGAGTERIGAGPHLRNGDESGSPSIIGGRVHAEHDGSEGHIEGLDGFDGGRVHGPAGDDDHNAILLDGNAEA